MYMIMNMCNVSLCNCYISHQDIVSHTLPATWQTVYLLSRLGDHIYAHLVAPSTRHIWAIYDTPYSAPSGHRE